jgi:hypothetical protein
MTSEPRKYSPSEIRLAKIFVMVLFVIGGVSLMMGLATLDRWPKDMNAAYTPKTGVSEGAADQGKKAGAKYSGNIPLMYLVTSVAFLALGAAGMMAIAKVVKNGGKDG